MMQIWEMSASQYLTVKGTHEPWICEISLSQYAGLSERQRKQYDDKRRKEWDTAAKGKHEFENLVAEAYAKGEISEDTPSLSQDAKWAIIRYKKQQEEKRQRIEQTKRNHAESVEKFTKAQELSKRDFAKWWSERRIGESPQCEFFKHVFRQEANRYWNWVHGQNAKAPIYVQEQVYIDSQRAKSG